MTQNYLAVRGNSAALATDLGSDNYQFTLTIVDDAGIYDGTDVAIGMKVATPPVGGVQMKLYDITAVSGAFVGQVTVTVNDPSAQGDPGFGNFAVVEPNASGALPSVSGVDSSLQQAITQYNLDISGSGDNIYTADGIVALDRVLTLNGNTVTFKDGTTEAIISAAQFKILNADLEIEGGAAITHSPNGDRWSTTTNNIGASVTVKLP